MVVTFSSRTTILLPCTSRSSSVSPWHSASMLNLTIRRASSLRWFDLRCSLTPNATPVTEGIDVSANRPMTILCGWQVYELLQRFPEFGGVAWVETCSPMVLGGLWRVAIHWRWWIVHLSLAMEWFADLGVSSWGTRSPVQVADRVIGVKAVKI